MARKIVVTSGKGGVGKTTLAINLGVALSKKGERVIVCDADFGLNNADVIGGVESLVTYDVVDVIEGRCRAQQALVRHPDYTNLYLLASHSAPERYISPQVLKLVLEELSPKYDFILIDCPAGVDEGFHRAVATSDEAIVVTTPHLPSIRDANKVVTLLKSYDLKEISFVANMVRGELLAAGECLSPREMENLLKIPLLGVVGEERELYVNEISENIRAFRVLASNLLTGKRKILDVTAPYTGAIGGLRRFLKKSL
jgi:septum site-determining protein MinD